MFYVGNLISAFKINPNPILKTIDEVGGQAEKGKKTLSKYKACKGSKNKDGSNNFDEIPTLYNKNYSNTMIGNELFHLLTDLAEKLTEEEAQSLMKEICKTENDNRCMPFICKWIFLLKYILHNSFISVDI